MKKWFKWYRNIRPACSLAIQSYDFVWYVWSAHRMRANSCISILIGRSYEINISSAPSVTCFNYQQHQINTKSIHTQSRTSPGSCFEHCIKLHAIKFVWHKCKKANSLVHSFVHSFAGVAKTAIRKSVKNLIFPSALQLKSFHFSFYNGRSREKCRVKMILPETLLPEHCNVIFTFLWL